jgi:metallo-beta-lactamase class B
MHISYKATENWGRISANGLIYINKKKAFIFDTPWTDTQTRKLIAWTEDSLNVKIVGFIPNHWHEDCMGGIISVHTKKIKSYANQMTIDIAKEKRLPMPENGFNDSLHLSFGRQKISCYYPGAAHTFDNIVIWLPSEQILFGGCVLKGMEYNNLGFTDDGDINEYPNTLAWLLAKFPDAKIVIPGHGKYGGIELIHHNIKLANQ